MVGNSGKWKPGTANQNSLEPNSATDAITNKKTYLGPLFFWPGIGGRRIGTGLDIFDVKS
jgi:hypothetical protein